MAITIIGDVHGYTKTYQKFVDKLPVDQRSIQIGDMGIGFKGIGLHEMSDNHKWFRGNHDAPEKCRENPNYLGDWGYIPEIELFWVAGAFSIDRDMRTEGVSWWADEELSYQELQKAADFYEFVKPKYVISHEAPQKAANVLLANLLGPYFLAKGECANSRTGQALQLMLERHAPEKWIFGHYHIDKEFYTPGFDTKFIAVGGIMSSGEQPHVYELHT